MYVNPTYKIRPKHYGKYSPFADVTNQGMGYDLQLKKDGVIVNIINNTVVSTNGELTDSVMADLAKLGIKANW